MTEICVSRSGRAKTVAMHLHLARLRELWAHVLRAQAGFEAALESRNATGSLPAHLPCASEPATSAAALAYGIALYRLPGLRPVAWDFYLTTVGGQAMLRFAPNIKAEVVTAWREAFNRLEAAVRLLA